MLLKVLGGEFCLKQECECVFLIHSFLYVTCFLVYSVVFISF